MRDDDVLPVSTPTSSSSVSFVSSSSSSRKDASSHFSAVFGRGRYKFWAFGVILMLAFWSMLTGTVSLRWSAGDLDDSFSQDYHSPSADDLDVLDMEEREKMVRHMWDVYTNSQRMRLPDFWQEAFVAAYEDLTSEVPEVREDAISEIAKMSARYLDINLPPQHPSISLVSSLL
ncbi:polyol transporter [Perilla frutescens var. hirtella]|uniref:Polyol transporter n=1 Tax=Perilla frutescens var. hirtella TaxID=608512 RepID=A0AAD4NZG0_PERFH|nr:polyol transporter [Perilla frutescens var. hirtella]KAH6820377.1 polyol transporter [Perilla frutescens var. hirtella]